MVKRELLGGFGQIRRAEGGEVVARLYSQKNPILARGSEEKRKPWEKMFLYLGGLNRKTVERKVSL